MSEDLITTTKLIIKDLSLEDSDLTDFDSLDELRSALLKIINYLLNKDFERLVQALYRIDINESKVKKVLATSDPESIAKEITELIIQRELQKVETRKKYSSN